MKEITLTKGRIAIVNDEDFEFLNKHKWCVNSENFANSKIKGKTITMHRFLLKPSKDEQIDHINGNRLDNRRSNLRVCDGSHNCANRLFDKRVNKSGFKGVYKRDNVKSKTIWRAKIRVGQKYFHLGVFETKEEAALAYNRMALKHFGDFARLNQI